MKEVKSYRVKVSNGTTEQWHTISAETPALAASEAMNLNAGFGGIHGAKVVAIVVVPKPRKPRVARGEDRGEVLRKALGVIRRDLRLAESKRELALTSLGLFEKDDPKRAEYVDEYYDLTSKIATLVSTVNDLERVITRYYSDAAPCPHRAVVVVGSEETGLRSAKCEACGVQMHRVGDTWVESKEAR